LISASLFGRSFEDLVPFLMASSDAAAFANR
jgi:hypothetical protein